MQEHVLSRVSDAVLLRDLAALIAKDRLTIARILAHLAEVDARRLYAPAGYPSMHAFCVGELRFSEDAAYKRIQAARAARRFPALFAAVAGGRLHLAAVCLLAPHLTAENVEELIQTATHRPKSQVEAFLARRFSVPGMPAPVRVLPPAPCRPIPQLATGPAEEGGPSDTQLAPGQVEDAETAPGAPSTERYRLHLTIGKATHDKLRYAQALLSHAIPSGDPAQVLDRALEALIVRLEKRKFGARARSRAKRNAQGSRQRSSSTGKRYIPAPVRRAVWERDRGQCTFVGAGGRRCKAQRFLEFDHVVPVARGGTATVEGLRLRCRAHNQYEAERVFGAGFMSRKRHEARPAAPQARGGSVAPEGPAPAELRDEHEEILAGLRSLGCRGELARRAAEFSRTVQGASLEDRLRAALQFVGSRSARAPIRASAPRDTSARSALRHRRAGSGIPIRGAPGSSPTSRSSLPP